MTVLPVAGRRGAAMVALALLVSSLALSGCRFTNLQEPAAPTATPNPISNLSTPTPNVISNLNTPSPRPAPPEPTLTVGAPATATTGTTNTSNPGAPGNTTTGSAPGNAPVNGPTADQEPIVQV